MEIRGVELDMKMKMLSTTLSSLAVAMMLVAPTISLAQGKSRGNDRKKEVRREVRRDDDRRYDNRRDDNRNWNSGTSDMRVGHADGQTFRIRRENGGNGRPPVYNWNAPVNRRENDRYNDDRRYDDRRYDDNRYDDRRYDDRRYDDNRNNDYRWNDNRWNENQRREQTKNEWKNIGIGSGIVAILGLLGNDSSVTFAGAAGALYSAYRYEQDRKSQNRTDRARYDLFSQDHFVRDGRRYDRKTVYQNGQKYYQFVCR